MCIQPTATATKPAKAARTFRLLCTRDDARRNLECGWSVPVEVTDKGRTDCYEICRDTVAGQWLCSKVHPDGSGLTSYTVVTVGRPEDWSCNHDSHVWATGVKWCRNCKHVKLVAAVLTILGVQP